MYLPNEIVLQILTSLKKSDLKSARLVSKTWATFAAERLFAHAYVSAHPDNLDVFIAITQHPLLSKCVKTLIYDAVDFVDNYTKERYFLKLWQQTHRDLLCVRSRNFLKPPSLDPEIYTWMTLVLRERTKSGLDLPKGYNYYQFVQESCKDYRFIDCGYQNFRGYAALQRAHFNSEKFFETLVGGLQKLSNLACVLMKDEWPRPQLWVDDPMSLFQTRKLGSPMARNWNMTHLRPQSWEWMPQDYESDLASGATDGAKHYRVITDALIRSQRKIQKFVLDHEQPQGIPPYVFDRRQLGSNSFHGFDVVALSGLKELKLSIAAYGGEATPEYFPNMDGLRFLLGSMHHLEVLDLKLPADPRDDPTLYKHDQIFPREGQWSQLKSLSLQNVASTAEDFLVLLTRKSPILSNLELGMVELLTGTWDGVIECMMQSMHLSKFNIIYDTAFLHRGGIDFLESKHYPDPEVIEKYVENGGRHPALQTHEPDSAAQRYVTEDLERFCRAGFYNKSNHAATDSFQSPLRHIRIRYVSDGSSTSKFRLFPS